jgi:hypothetical protein
MGSMDTGQIILIALLICAFCGVQIVIVGLLVWYSAARRKGANKWTSFAKKYGLSHQPPGFMEGGYGSMGGKMDGRDVTFYTYSTGGRSRVVWTVASVRSSSPKAVTFSVGAKGFDGAVYKAFGAQDIVIGIKDFDDAFMIQSNPPELASALLLQNADLRAMIQTLKPYELQYKDRFASCRLLRSQADEAVLLNMLALARKLAETLEGEA